ncbi:hypothetical protein JOD97_000017 [Duganella sp. 1411]|uniref:hypothetical protein n=1 Tax=Duganella sp. 1411 TaxID=2806572 RepID=UPI001AE1E987|nr:hypothetical protein [Duganella sp. 1411]MBP1202003.1 hypothetical protein [Duganella sp. 1411]
MKKVSFASLATAALIVASAPATAQTAPATEPVTQATYVRDWTVDGTRDHLLSAAQQFFGHDSAFYISLPREEANSELVGTQFAYAFHGIPEPEIDLESGHKLFVGADPESIREKALVLTDADRSTVRALAILHRSCGGKKRMDPQTRKATTCPRATTLTFFVHDGERLEAAERKEVTKWVRADARRHNEKVKKQAQITDSNLVQAIHVEIRKVHNQ